MIFTVFAYTVIKVRGRVGSHASDEICMMDLGACAGTCICSSMSGGRRAARCRHLLRVGTRNVTRASVGREKLRALIWVELRRHSVDFMQLESVLDPRNEILVEDSVTGNPATDYNRIGNWNFKSEHLRSGRADCGNHCPESVQKILLETPADGLNFSYSRTQSDLGLDAGGTVTRRLCWIFSTDTHQASKVKQSTSTIW